LPEQNEKENNNKVQAFSALAASSYLAKSGHDVHVYEKMNQ
jgi:hypothetical protein